MILHLAGVRVHHNFFRRIYIYQKRTVPEAGSVFRSTGLWQVYPSIRYSNDIPGGAGRCSTWYCFQDGVCGGSHLGGWIREGAVSNLFIVVSCTHESGSPGRIDGVFTYCGYRSADDFRWT